MLGKLPFLSLRSCSIGWWLTNRSNRFAAVVSHVNQVSSSATSPSYALIILNTAARSGLLVVESSIQLGYQPVSQPQWARLFREETVCGVLRHLVVHMHMTDG